MTKCLANVRAPFLSPTSPPKQRPLQTPEPMSPARTIFLMSAEQFLHISDHALVNIARGEDDNHVVRAKRLNFEEEDEEKKLEGPKDNEDNNNNKNKNLADEVTHQVDEILARFRMEDS